MSDETMFDVLDTELRRRFEALPGGPLDTNAVLDSMRPRLQRAKRRHRLMIAGAATLALEAVAALALVAMGPHSDNSVGVRPSRGPETTTSVAPRPSTPSTTAGTTTPPRTSDPRRAPAPPSSAPASGTSATTPSTVVPTTSAAVSNDTTYSSAGGSIVVHNTGSAISLVSGTPSSGFGVEIHDNGPTRVEVRFNNGSTEWRIRVDLVNGQLQPQITQH